MDDYGDGHRENRHGNSVSRNFHKFPTYPCRGAGMTDYITPSQLEDRLEK
jgi:hypothetical protein